MRNILTVHPKPEIRTSARQRRIALTAGTFPEVSYWKLAGKSDTTVSLVAVGGFDGPNWPVRRDLLLRPRMAKFSIPLLLIVCVAAGCQPQGSVTDSSPRPSFNAPVITRPAQAFVPRPTKSAPMAAAPAVRGKQPVVVTSAVPAGWAPPVASRPWRWIVIHHSDTPNGSAAKFDAAHKAKGWDELGYHFVIGNGTETGDGQVEIGPRWPKQKWGAHAKTPDNKFNDYGIGICLVGNFQDTRPTQAQMQSLAKLTAYLMKTYKISPDRVIGHRDTKATECPGRNLNLDTVRRMATSLLADSGWTPDEKTVAAGEELLKAADHQPE